MNDSCIPPIFKFFRNFYVVFSNDCISIYSHQQGIGIPVSPPPHQHLLFCGELFQMIAILTGVCWNLIVVFICIPQMASHARHFFMCFMDICALHFENWCACPSESLTVLFALMLCVS